MVAAAVILQIPTAPRPTEQGCFTALSYTLEQVDNHSGALEARARDNLEAASEGRLQRNLRVSTESFSAVERVCQQFCAIWTRADNEDERARFGKSLDECLKRAMNAAKPAATSAAVPAGKPAPPLPPDDGYTKVDSFGPPSTEGANSARSCEKTGSADDYKLSLKLTGRPRDADVFGGCCIRLPKRFQRPWEEARVTVSALAFERVLHVKIESDTGKHAYLHSGHWKHKGPHELRGPLDDLEGAMPTKFCVMAVGPNDPAENEIEAMGLAFRR